MTPAHVHIHFDVLFNARMLLICTVGEPGTQGDGVAGTQGAGVGTPPAAAVVAITAGLVGAMHMPKEGMLMRGLWSAMLAASFGPPAVTGGPSGVTISALGVRLN